MAFVDGDALGRPATGGRCSNQAIAIADGLAAAHAAGVVHRDLKPDNILVRRDGVIRFWISAWPTRRRRHPPDADDAVTGAGAIVGTVAYMSPEQATGREIDARSEIVYLRPHFYELASGKRPFERPSSAETMAAIIRDEAEPLPADVPRPLASIIERCLAKDPALRYDTTRGTLYRELATVRQHFSEISAPQCNRPCARSRAATGCATVR